jgi:hypothetical protein
MSEDLFRRRDCERNQKEVRLVNDAAEAVTPLHLTSASRAEMNQVIHAFIHINMSGGRHAIHI